MKRINASLLGSVQPMYEPSVEETLHNLVFDLSDISNKIVRSKKPLYLNSELQNYLYEEEIKALKRSRNILCRRISDLIRNINNEGESDMACGTKVKGGKKKPTKKK